MVLYNSFIFVATRKEYGEKKETTSMAAIAFQPYDGCRDDAGIQDEGCDAGEKFFCN